MKLNFVKSTCRVLAASVLVLSFQTAQAGLIGAERAMEESAGAGRTQLLETLQRADVAGQLQSLGVDPNAAADRVARMSDQEVQQLMKDLPAAPAAGDVSTAGWVAIVLIAIAIWYWLVRA